jgi:hypothetical protein
MKYHVASKNRTFIDLQDDLGDASTVVAVNTRGCRPMTKETAEAIAALVGAVKALHVSRSSSDTTDKKEGA